MLNTIPPRGSLGDDARQAVAGYGVEIASVEFGQRAAYQHALTAGLTAQEYEPSGKAADETIQLYMWICTQVGMITRGKTNKPKRHPA